MCAKVFSDVDAERTERSVLKSEGSRREIVNAPEATISTAYPPGVALTNGEASLAPLGALGVLTLGEEDDETYTLAQATQLGDLPLCITAGEMPVGGPGHGWSDNRPHKVLMTSGGYSAISIGDRIGLTIDAWTAQAQATGPLVVLEKITDTALVLAVWIPFGDPPLMKLTANPSAGTVPAKRVNASGVVTGDNETFLDASAW